MMMTIKVVTDFEGFQYASQFTCIILSNPHLNSLRQVDIIITAISREVKWTA